MSLPSELLAADLTAPDLVARPSGKLLRVIAGGGSEQAAVERDEDALRYRSFLEALGVAVYTTDAAGRITFFNEAAVAFWGRRPELGEEWCGSLSLFSVDGTPMPHDACPMAIALKEHRPVRGSEAIALRPDGSKVQFTPFPTPLFDDDGQLAGAVNVLIDITERRRTEAALQASDRALAAATAVRDEFLGLVSHELRTPVTTIFGNATLLYGRGDHLTPDVRHEMIGDIAAEAGRLHLIVDNLLHLTRLEAGVGIDLEPQVFPRLVERAVGAFRRCHSEREVILSVSPWPLLVSADATHLELVVTNLLINAHKYSPIDWPIEVEVSEVDGQAQLLVRDHGIGIDPATVGDLFQPFYRAPEARATAGGLGIGLALCQRIMAVVGGRIWGRPHPDGGSEFGIALPLIDPATLA